MFLGKIAQNLVLKYFRTIDRLKSDPAINIFLQLHQAKHVLICVPHKTDDFSIAQQYFNALGRAFPNAIISVLLHEDQALSEFITIPHRIITITPKHFTYWGFPHKRFLRTVKGKWFDVVIDLTPDFDFLSTFVCRASGSKLRICLSNTKRDPFFNFLIRTNPALPLERRYDTLIHYLQAGVHANTSVSPE